MTDHRQEADRPAIRINAALDPAQATGDPRLADSLVTNLIDNAIRHNVDRGWVKITTATTGQQATLGISNTGPVIPPGEVDRLFQPFQRLGTERIGHDTGHGLGLAIVRAIAGMHGATLTANARPDGGPDIHVSFPLRPAKAPMEDSRQQTGSAEPGPPNGLTENITSLTGRDLRRSRYDIRRTLAAARYAAIEPSASRWQPQPRPSVRRRPYVYASPRGR
jgi:Histidine kinase-, DNA gyrase B-, and HSP90-like ATPase